MSPVDFLRFREELHGWAEAGELSRHQVARMLTEARRFMRGLVASGALDAERFFLLLRPKPSRRDYDPRVLASRAFENLSRGVAATYRRGAQALLLYLEARGKDLAGITREDWIGFREELMAQVRRGEIKRALARMRLTGARRFLEEKLRVGLLSAEVLAEPQEPSAHSTWPAALRPFPARIEEAMTASGLAPSTREHYTRAVHDFLGYLASQGITDLTEVTREVVTAYQLALQQRSPRNDAPYAVSTQIGILAGLRLFFAYLVKAGYLLADPSSHLVYPRAPQRLPRPLGVEAMRRLLRSLPATLLGRRDRAILELLYGTGIRGGEIVRLAVQDVDLEAATLMIREGKGRKDRVVPLGRAAKEALLDYLDCVRPKLVRGGTASLLLARHGGPLSSRGMRRRLAELGARMGIKLHPHLLRHTCATHLLKGRADIRQIQRLLGHKSLATTERYTRVEVSDLREVIRRCHPREKGL